MISKFVCTACKVEVTKENGAQPGCPACGFGWQTAPKITWPEIAPWVVPTYPPYIPVPTFPDLPVYPVQPWYEINWTICSDSTLGLENNPTTISTTGFKYGH